MHSFVQSMHRGGDQRFAAVEATDGSWDVRVGKADVDSARAIAQQWVDMGWAVTVTIGAPGRRSPLRAPYYPVRCFQPGCRWAGLNLGVHHARAHAGLPPPEGHLIAEVLRDQTRTARATSELNRRPRAGMLVVKQPSDSIAEVYRVERVDTLDRSAELWLFGQRERGETVRVALAELLRDYRPVGTWSRE